MRSCWGQNHQSMTEYFFIGIDGAPRLSGPPPRYGRQFTRRQRPANIHLDLDLAKESVEPQAGQLYGLQVSTSAFFTVLTRDWA
jgi:hypothetical protein